MSGLLALSGLSALSGLAAGFQRLWLDMSNLSALSGLAAGFQRRWPDMSGPDPDMFEFLTPQQLDSLEGYKRPTCLSSMVDHSFHIINTLRYSLELLTSLLQALFKSKLPTRDLRLTLE
jgi:hypothetical protein